MLHFVYILRIWCLRMRRFLFTSSLAAIRCFPIYIFILDKKFSSLYDVNNFIEVTTFIKMCRVFVHICCYLYYSAKGEAFLSFRNAVISDKNFSTTYFSYFYASVMYSLSRVLSLKCGL